MDSYKLIEDTIKIEAINRDGKVFERGKLAELLTECSFSYLCELQCEQASRRAGHQLRHLPD